MNKKMWFYLSMLAALLAFLSSCVTLSPQAKQIQIVRNSQEVSACQRIGPVSTKTMACVDPTTCEEAAEAEGRNQAAAMGAKHLLVTYNGITFTHGVFEGFAYQCAEDSVGVQRMEMTTPNSTNSFTGCTKDIECKGDRICVSGQCVSP
jgi:hypothetical protein